MTFKKILEEKYKLVQEATFKWPKKIFDGYKFTGKVTPDGESAEYIDRHKNVNWFNKKFKHHNNFGPALILPNPYNNRESRMWFIDGMKHRLDGPAIVWQSGEREYWINNQQFSKEDFDEKVKEINALKQAGEPYGVDLNDL